MQYSLRADGTVSTFYTAREVVILRKTPFHKASTIELVRKYHMLKLRHPRTLPKTGGVFITTNNEMVAGNVYYNKPIWSRLSQTQLKKLLEHECEIPERDYSNVWTNYPVGDIIEDD